MRGEFKLPKAYVCEQVGDPNTHWAFVGGISLVKPFQRDPESHLSTAHTPSHSNPSQQEGQLTHTATVGSQVSSQPPHTHYLTHPPKNTCTLPSNHITDDNQAQKPKDLALPLISGDQITRDQLRCVHTWYVHVPLIWPLTTCNHIL